MDTVTKDVCVIGCGWSGLYALKYAQQQGLDCVAVEQRGAIGGLWAHNLNTEYTTCTDVTYTSSPQLFTQATDFPWPDEFGFYATYTQIYSWLKSYSAHFKLNENIMLDTTVVGTTKEGDLWQVQIKNKKTSKCSTILCKNLIVCSGVNAKINDLSTTEKYKNFKGESVHSDKIRSVEEYKERVKDKNVVSIGGGENGSDLAYHLSLSAKSYTHCIPNGHWMQIRTFSTLAVPINEFAPVTRENSQGSFPWEYQKVPARNFIRPMWGSNGWDRMITTAINGPYGHGQKPWEPIGPIYCNFGNKADLLHHAVANKKVIPKRDIKSIAEDGKTITFCDGSVQEEVDFMVMCTGYAVEFPFLAAKYRPKKIRDLYKNIFSVEDPTLAFVGFSRPTQGSITQIAELASIFVAKVFAKKATLPATLEMRATALSDKDSWEKFYRYSSGRVTGLVDGIIYSQQLCAAMGNPFSLSQVLRDHGVYIWLCFLFSPCTAHTFLGGMPEYNEVFTSFVKNHTFLHTSKKLVFANILFGFYDFLFYQIGRLENIFNELFDKRTREAVCAHHLLTESPFELWWLTRVWDGICVVFVLMAVGGYHSLLKTILFYLAITMVVVHVGVYVLVTQGTIIGKQLCKTKLLEKMAEKKSQ